MYTCANVTTTPDSLDVVHDGLDGGPIRLDVGSMRARQLRRSARWARRRAQQARRRVHVGPTAPTECPMGYAGPTASTECTMGSTHGSSSLGLDDSGCSLFLMFLNVPGFSLAFLDVPEGAPRTQQESRRGPTGCVIWCSGAPRRAACLGTKCTNDAQKGPDQAVVTAVY